MKELLIFSILLMAVGLIWNVVKKNDLEILPSFLWLTLMMVPYWFQYDTFADLSRSTHVLAIIYIGVCLFIGDSVRLQSKLYRTRGVTALEKWLDSPWLYAGLFLVISVYHLSQLAHIPLVEKYIYGVSDATQLSEMREKTSKLLTMPDVVKHIFNWSINILAPVAVVLAVRQKKYFLAAAVLGLAVFYAMMSLAKTQIVFLLVSFFFVALFSISYQKRLRVYLSLFILSIPIMWDSYNYLANNPVSVLNGKVSSAEIEKLNLPDQDPRKVFSIGDHSRLLESSARDGLGAKEKVYDYFFYRVFLSPADVATRWYQFFPKESNGFIGLQGLKPKDRSQAGQTHPARLVGHWAYTERFPARYLETVQAYSSVDADAYSRFGVPGILIAGLLVILLRLALKLFKNDLMLNETLYIIALVLGALWWPSVSLQALLVAQGVFLIMFALFLLYILRLKKNYALIKLKD